MIQEEINKLATITTRYANLNIAAKDAAKAINMVKFLLFTDFISEEEKNILENSMNIMHDISNRTSKYDAITYFKTEKFE